MADGGGPIQTRPAAMHGFGEGGVLREEAVAGVDRGGAGLARGGQDLGGDKVALGGGGRADGDGDVGFADVRRGGVGLGIDGDGAHAETPRGADDAAGDLAPVGDEDRRHQCQSRFRTPKRWDEDSRLGRIVMQALKREPGDKALQFFPSHRDALARSARALWPSHENLQPVQPLATSRGVTPPDGRNHGRLRWAGADDRLPLCVRSPARRRLEKKTVEFAIWARQLKVPAMRGIVGKAAWVASGAA